MKILLVIIALLSSTSCLANKDQSDFIQKQIDAATAKRIPYTLPTGPIYLHKPLIIRKNTRIIGNQVDYGTNLFPVGVSAIVIDGDNSEGGWSFGNTLEGFTIIGDLTTSPLIVIRKTYSTRLNRVRIQNQVSTIGVDISDSNHIQLNGVILYGKSKAGKTGLKIHGKATVTLNDIDIENYYQCMETNGGQVNLNSPYVERCIVNIRHNGGAVSVFGGYLKAINGYNLGINADNLNTYGTSLESYTNNILDGKVAHCFKESYDNVELEGLIQYDGYLENSNCVGVE